jgi:hypothetical protein
MRFAGQASRSNKFAIFWTAAMSAVVQQKKLFFDLEGYLRKVALRVAWPSFVNTSAILMRPAEDRGLGYQYGQAQGDMQYMPLPHATF